MKYILIGKGKGTYNAGNPLTGENIWPTYKEGLIAPVKLIDIERSGAANDQALLWSDSLGRWAPSNVALISSKWTEESGNIYRASRVTVGQSSVIGADLGVFQTANGAPALHITGRADGNYRVTTILGYGGTDRHFLTSLGLPTWVINASGHEAGRLSFTTPLSQASNPTIGVLTYFAAHAPTSQRGFIVWKPLNTNGAADSCIIGTNGVTHQAISATGRMRFGSTSGYIPSCSYTYKLVSGDTIIAGWSDATLARFLIHEGGGIQTDNLNSSLSKPWKLGQKIEAAVSLDTTKYISVQVDGIEYKLALANV